MTNDRIKILCSKCNKPFGEMAPRLRTGYQVQCPHCMKLIAFGGSKYQASAQGGAGFADSGGGSDCASAYGGSSTETRSGILSTLDEPWCTE
jgi:DNA-directed RNA polymerase subunit RPC12/RpoP